MHKVWKGLRTKEDYSGTAVKNVARYIYKTGNSGA